MPFPRWAKPTDEEYIQGAIVDYLSFVYPDDNPTLLWFHVPNQRANKNQRIFLAAMGVKPGVADLCFISKGGVAFVEVKTDTGRQSKAQKKFQARCDKLKQPYIVCHDVEEVEAFLAEWLC